VVQPALAILQRYPFPERSSQKGAAAIYQALLHQTQGEASQTFQVLGQVTDYYAPARLLRDTWMDGLLCLPLPKTPEQSEPIPATNTAPKGNLAQKSAQDIVQKAAHILLYPDIEILQSQCESALQQGRFTDALETLRRLLFLDPQHTPSLERRWRIYLKLEETEAAKDDLFFLMDVYEREKKIVACHKVAVKAVSLFPEDERALLKMCFLQARLGAPTRLANYGRQLLRLCRRRGLHDRENSYRRWLLRQGLALDDRVDFEVS
jgi:tetratricopeptide (TPR) repeat protein